MSGLDIEAELHDLIARRDINKALCAYARGHDRRIREKVIEAFHGDALSMCGEHVGSIDGFMDVADNFLTSNNVSVTHHMMGQADIDVQGDKASGEIYFIAYHKLGEAPAKSVLISGRYIDEYERRDGVWRIAKRNEIFDWIHEAPAADDFLKAFPAQSLGKYGAADFAESRAWPT